MDLRLVHVRHDQAFLYPAYRYPSSAGSDMVSFQTHQYDCRKNHAQNCLTISNLKLDDVFSDVFGKFSKSITEHLPAHLGETFDVTFYVDKRCKTLIREIQDAVDGAVSPEQTVKLRQYLNHIDGSGSHIETVTQKILQISDKYSNAPDLIRTVPGFNYNLMTAIQILSEICSNISVK